jgi:hypothetical protein
MTGLPANDVCELSSTDLTEETIRQHLDNLERQARRLVRK